MTLLIDNFTVTGTPEELETFIKLYKHKSHYYNDWNGTETVIDFSTVHTNKDAAYLADNLDTSCPCNCCNN